jgi:hemerythrin superfamily protein
MFQEYKSLSDEDLDSKMESVMKKIQMAHRMGHDVAVEQLQHFLEMMQLELMERSEKMRFKMIIDRTPESLIIGEDDDTNASTGSNKKS